MSLKTTVKMVMLAETIKPMTVRLKSALNKINTENPEAL